MRNTLRLVLAATAVAFTGQVVATTGLAPAIAEQARTVHITALDSKGATVTDLCHGRGGPEAGSRTSAV